MAVCAMLVAQAASAGAWSKGCQFTGGNITGTIGTPTNASTRLGPGEFGCYRFNNADGTHNSTLVYVTADSANIIVDTQLDAEVLAATTALVVPYVCPQGAPINTANPEFSCTNQGGANGNAALDGVGGPSTTQNASQRVGPGTYYFRITGACLAGDTCQVAVRAEGL